MVCISYYSLLIPTYIPSLSIHSCHNPHRLIMYSKVTSNIHKYIHHLLILVTILNIYICNMFHNKYTHPSLSTFHHHAASRNTTQHYATSRSTTHHYAAPRSITLHSPHYYTDHSACLLTSLYPTPFFPSPPTSL